VIIFAAAGPAGAVRAVIAVTAVSAVFAGAFTAFALTVLAGAVTAATISAVIAGAFAAFALTVLAGAGYTTALIVVFVHVLFGLCVHFIVHMHMAAFGKCIAVACGQIAKHHHESQKHAHKFAFLLSIHKNLRIYIDSKVSTRYSMLLEA
jgi:hypothetical protein